MGREEAADQRPGDARDAEDAAEQPDVAAALAWRDDVADRRLGAHHQPAAAEPLNRAERDQLAHALGGAAERRADEEEHQGGLEHELAAVEVAELAVERCHDRDRQQVRGDDPGEVVEPAELAHDRRQRRRDDRLVERRQEHDQHQRPNHREHAAPPEVRRGGVHQGRVCARRSPGARRGRGAGSSSNGWKCVATRADVPDSALLRCASELPAADPALPNAECHLDRPLDGQGDTRPAAAGTSAPKSPRTSRNAHTHGLPLTSQATAGVATRSRRGHDAQHASEPVGINHLGSPHHEREHHDHRRSPGGRALEPRAAGRRRRRRAGAGAARRGAGARRRVRRALSRARSPSSTRPGSPRRCASSRRSRDLAGRAGTYASLAFAVDTVSPEVGALCSRCRSARRQLQTTLLFFELEWNELDDERARGAARRRRARLLPPLPEDGAPLPAAPADRARGADPDRDLGHRSRRLLAPVHRADLGDHGRALRRRRAAAADGGAQPPAGPRPRAARRGRGRGHRGARARAAHPGVHLQHAASGQGDAGPAALLRPLARRPKPRQRGLRRVGRGADRGGASGATSSPGAGIG